MAISDEKKRREAQLIGCRFVGSQFNIRSNFRRKCNVQQGFPHFARRFVKTPPRHFQINTTAVQLRPGEVREAYGTLLTHNSLSCAIDSIREETSFVGRLCVQFARWEVHWFSKSRILLHTVRLLHDLLAR